MLGDGKRVSLKGGCKHACTAVAPPQRADTRRTHADSTSSHLALAAANTGCGRTEAPNVRPDKSRMPLQPTAVGLLQCHGRTCTHEGMEGVRTMRPKDAGECGIPAVQTSHLVKTVLFQLLQGHGQTRRSWREAHHPSRVPVLRCTAAYECLTSKHRIQKLFQAAAMLAACVWARPKLSSVLHFLVRCCVRVLMLWSLMLYIPVSMVEFNNECITRRRCGLWLMCYVALGAGSRSQCGTPHARS